MTAPAPASATRPEALRSAPAPFRRPPAAGWLSPAGVGASAPSGAAVGRLTRTALTTRTAEEIHP
ncbi:hypothetical protein [Streptomyces subrutilus]|uniref:hypothetical protein n=1 Tax=Streptomyces subrutilus TaxID=36818 RepID=UPI0033F10393